MVFSACSSDSDNISYPAQDEEIVEVPEVPEDPGAEDDDELVPNTQTVSYNNAVSITFSGSEVTVDNPLTDGVSITHTNGHVIIISTITDKEVNYILSGVTSNGSVKIYGEYKFGLVLNGTGITNPNGAAINIQCGKKVTVTVVNQTNNRLIDGATYTHVEGEDMKGTFFSEGQLNFYGSGLLEVRGKNKHAICTDDYFRMYEGNIHVKEAASDAIHAKDYVQIEGGRITTRSAGEGIDCDGYVEINSGTLEIVTTAQKGHGIKCGEYLTINQVDKMDISVYGNASKGINATGDVTIVSGTITINTAGDAIWEADEADTSSSAGIKCDGNVVIDNGEITIVSAGKGGKGINVDGTLTINNGTLAVTTTGDQYVYDRNNDTAAKAVKSDGNLTINGGNITLRTYKTEAEGLESKATLTITGGTVVVEAYDDCINASNHIQIDGGYVYCKSSVNDAIDSNGTLSITGGVVIAAGATSPEGGIDCDQSRFSITGGTIVGIGGDTSTPTASACTQSSVIFRSSTANIPIVHIANSSDNSEVITFKLPVTYQSGVVMLVSSAALKANTGYTIYTGGEISGNENFYGLYTAATYKGGSNAGTFTTGTAGSVSTVGTSGGPGGGPGGGWRP
ncbi:carbohydrate-binding domain-containing protein [Bacteroides sp. 519]|nr:carbohydrate-binding domain-containing protein [Bacteroides sp. 519]